MEQLSGTIEKILTVQGGLSGVGRLDGSISLPTDIPPEYEGEYVFTPSDAEQEIQIGGYTATQNIIINPIPTDYGKITWDGTTITVS